MLRVLADAGLPAHRSPEDGVYNFTFPLPADEADAALSSYAIPSPSESSRLT
jgi:hypothetical protein